MNAHPHRAADPLSPAQLRAIWAKAHALGLDEELLRDVVEAETGGRSISSLSRDQASGVLNRLGQERAPRRRRSRKRGDPGALITREQAQTIEHNYEDLCWQQQARASFNKRMCGKPWPQTVAEAQKIIEAQRAMLARKQPKTKLIEQLDQRRAKLTDWEQRFVNTVRGKRRLSSGQAAKLREIHAARVGGDHARP
ncbi:MAG: DUF1018 domain-containing protein [Candidatus Alcyoniella australis]|nr:DUF1018 domain-containing protein [Candidatus Alcyoniella australis]